MFDSFPDNEFFIFKFKSCYESQRMLEEGPWFVNGHRLVLRRWTEDLTFCKEQLDTIPNLGKIPKLENIM